MTQQPSPLKFCLLVVALSIPFWLIGPLAEHLTEGIKINLPVSALMAVCPLIAALIYSYKEAKLPGIRRLFQRVFSLQGIRSPLWFLPMIFTMPLIAVLSYLVLRLLGRPLPPPQIPYLDLAIFFVAFFAGAVAEESGWMVYVVPPLQKRWTALQTNLAVGTLWGVWHTVPYLQAHNSPTWIAGQILFSVAARVIIGWLFNNTGQNVLSAILFHTMINVCWTAFPNYGSHYDPIVTGIITTVVAALITLVWGPKSLGRTS